MPISITTVRASRAARRRQERQIRPKTTTVASLKAALEFQLPTRVSTRQLAGFTRQLATLIQAKLALTKSLEILSEQSPGKRLRDITKTILTRIRAGQSLSDCLRAEPKVFSELFVSLVSVGEQGGILEKTLDRLAIYLEKTAGLQRKLLTAMTYPAVIILVAVGAVTFLLIAVVPTFAEMFQDFGGELPGPTRLLLATSGFVQDYFWWLFLGNGLLLLAFRRLRNTERGGLLCNHLALHTPFIGTVLKKNFVAKFCRTLGTLLESGVPLLRALEVAQNISRNQVFRRAIIEMKARVVQGKSLLELEGDPAPFTALTAQMIRVGEETGEMDRTLLKVAKFYEEELDAAVDAMTSVIEPVIIVVLGVVLGGTLVALYLQLFDLVNVIQ